MIRIRNCVYGGSRKLLSHADCLFPSLGTRNMEHSDKCNLLVFIILFVTLLFANFAEATAEAVVRPKPLIVWCKTREETPAKVLATVKSIPLAVHV